MWANTCWGLFGLAVTLGLAMIGLPSEYVWLQPWFLSGAVVSLVASVLCFSWPLWARLFDLVKGSRYHDDISIYDALDFIINDSTANLKYTPAPKIVEFGSPNGSLVTHYDVEHDNARIQINEKRISGDLTASGRRQLICHLPNQFERHRRPIPREYWDSYQIDFHSCLYYTEQHPQTCKLLRGKPDDLGNWTGLMLSKQQVRQLWPPQSLLRRLWKRTTRKPRIKIKPNFVSGAK